MAPVRKAIRPSTAAKLLDVNPMTVKRWLAAGRLEGYKLPTGPWRVYEDSVLAMTGAKEADDAV
jgi:excisionase family DNA binding protein